MVVDVVPEIDDIDFADRKAAEALIELLAERILVLDGATGTWMQAQDLTADDFGGPELEGYRHNLACSREHQALPSGDSTSARHEERERVIPGRSRRRQASPA